MKRLLPSISLCAAVLLSGCAFLAPPSITPGENESAVIARMGKPTARYPDGNGHLLEYRKGPAGQETFMVRIDPAGRVVSMEQVLTSARFASIKVNQDKKEDVLRRFGAPYETSYLPLSDLQIWSYTYLENDVWDSIMHIHFDRNGTVRLMINAPDPSRRPVSAPLG